MTRQHPTSIRRELLVSTAVLFGAAILVAVAVVAVTLPLLESPAQAALFIALIVASDLAVLFLFLRSLLGRAVFNPLERIGTHAEQVAAGGYEHRIPEEAGEELDRLVRSLNTMAERLIADQETLAENVRSLDRTNQELIVATEGLVRGARMASVGTLAAGLAHEVGNPLGALIGYLDVARQRGRSGGEMDPPLEAALEEARRIDRIVRSVLDFARPDRDETGKVEPLPVISLSDVVDRALALLQGRGALDGVEVGVQVEPGAHPVRARAQHLEQVLLNLLMNALWAVKGRADPSIRVRLRSAKATAADIGQRRAGDPPGVDYLHRRRIPLLLAAGTARGAMGFAGGEGDAAGASATEVLLEVEDNGPGIAPSRLPHLFDPFYTTKQPGEGTGLGLAITVRIVQELGGRLDAGNREEGGARFAVRLPEAASDPGPSGHPEEPGGASTASPYDESLGEGGRSAGTVASTRGDRSVAEPISHGEEL